MELLLLYILKMKIKRILLSLIIILLCNYKIHSSNICMDRVTDLKFRNYAENQSIVNINYEEADKDSISSNKIPGNIIPPLSFYRIAGECVGGFVVGAVGAYGLIILYGMGADKKIWGWDIGVSIILSDIGWILGNELGVYIVGNIGNETGSLLKTFIYGTAISIGIQAIAIGFYCLSMDEGQSNIYTLYESAMMFGPTIGAIIGFNITRKYKKQLGIEDGLINLSNKRICFNVPGVFSHSISGDKVMGIKLINIAF